MPLPKPVAKNASKDKKKAVMGKTLADLATGPHHKQRTRSQEIAIGLKQSGQSKEEPPEHKKQKRPRNKGR